MKEETSFVKGVSPVTIGIATVIVAVFTLFYVFNTIQNFADGCGTGESPAAICTQLTSFNLSMIIILLIIGGFAMIIMATAYILLSH